MIDGGYSILYIKWVDEFLPIGCLTSDSFSEEIEMLETTTRDNGGWKTSTPTNQNYNISFDGIFEKLYNFYNISFSQNSDANLVSLIISSGF